jgi:hypothetical protein
MSVPSHLDRILAELRQLLALATVITIILRAATLNILASRERLSYRAVGCSGLEGGTLAAFGAGGARAKIF